MPRPVATYEIAKTSRSLQPSASCQTCQPTRPRARNGTAVTNPVITRSLVSWATGSTSSALDRRSAPMEDEVAVMRPSSLRVALVRHPHLSTPCPSDDRREPREPLYQPAAKRRASQYSAVASDNDRQDLRILASSEPGAGEPSSGHGGDVGVGPEAGHVYECTQLPLP